MAHSIKSLINDEQQAQSDYADKIDESKKKKNKKAASVLGHIRSEEVEHESMLKKLGEQ